MVSNTRDKKEVPEPEEVMEFYFKAMMSGYINEILPIPVADHPGYWLFTFVDRKRRLIFEDRWFEVPNSRFTTGTTTIYYMDNGNKIPIWIMTYHGDYHEEALPLLKEALKSAFEEKLFIGGRGKSGVKSDSMVYENYPDARHSFTHFSGLEQITSYGKSLGRHYYEGHWLI